MVDFVSGVDFFVDEFDPLPHILPELHNTIRIVIFGAVVFGGTVDAAIIASTDIYDTVDNGEVVSIRFHKLQASKFISAIRICPK